MTGCGPCGLKDPLKSLKLLIVGLDIDVSTHARKGEITLHTPIFSPRSHGFTTAYDVVRARLLAGVSAEKFHTTLRRNAGKTVYCLSEDEQVRGLATMY